MKKILLTCLLILTASACVQNPIKEERAIASVTSYECFGEDALESISISSNTITLIYPSGEEDAWKTDVSAKEINNGVFANKTIVGHKKSSQMFGGAISDAVLFTIGNDGSGYVAYKSNVYKFSKCTAKK